MADTIETQLDSSADFHADMMVVGVEGQQCETFDPEALGLSQDVASQIAYVMEGHDCKPVYIHPDLVAEGCETSDVVPVNTNFRFDGTMYIMANEGGYDLQQGQLLYNAFKDSCNKYPSTAVKAIGVELKPTAKDGFTEMQARVEQGDLGELLLRVHIWKGDGQVFSIDGQTFLDLVAGDQVLITRDLKVLNAASVNPPGESITAGANIGSLDSIGNNPQASAYAANPGCSVPNGQPPHSAETLTPIFALVAALVIGRSLRQLGARVDLSSIGKYLMPGKSNQSKPSNLD